MNQLPEPSQDDPREDRQNRTTRLAKSLVAAVKPEDRESLKEWASTLVTIRGSSMNTVEKAREAVALTYRSGIAVKVAVIVGSRARDLVWSDRSWAARVGGAAAVATAAVAGGQGAGIAALGSAIGVPLWVVFGAGGAFAGAIIDEVSGSVRTQDKEPVSPPEDSEDIPEAEYEVISQEELYSVRLERRLAGPEADPDSGGGSDSEETGDPV